MYHHSHKSLPHTPGPSHPFPPPEQTKIRNGCPDCDGYSWEVGWFSYFHTFLLSIHVLTCGVRTEYQAANSEPMPFASAKYLGERVFERNSQLRWFWEGRTHLTYKTLVSVCLDSAIEPQKVMIWPSMSVSPSNSWKHELELQDWKGVIVLGYSWSCNHWACSAQTQRTGWKSRSPGLPLWSMYSQSAPRTLWHMICAPLIRSSFLQENPMSWAYRVRMDPPR